MDFKKCTKCHKIKPFDEFYKRNNRKQKVASECKECSRITILNYRRSKEGLITQIYSNQKMTSKYRNFSVPNYSKQELKNWCFSQEIFYELFYRWQLSDYKKELIPSCDRKDDYKGYSLDNIQLMTFQQNNKKGHEDQINGINNKINKSVYAYNKTTGKQIEFYSITEASRTTGVDCSNISACCLNKLKSAGGYVWKFI